MSESPQKDEEQGSKSNRMQELSNAGFPKPEITDQMRTDLRSIIGANGLVKMPHLDPDSLYAYYANTRPAYNLGGISFEHSTGPETWENAWDTMIEGINAMKRARML